MGVSILCVTTLFSRPTLIFGRQIFCKTSIQKIMSLAIEILTVTYIYYITHQGQIGSVLHGELNWVFGKGAIALCIIIVFWHMYFCVIFVCIYIYILKLVVLLYLFNMCIYFTFNSVLLPHHCINNIWL